MCSAQSNFALGPVPGFGLSQGRMRAAADRGLLEGLHAMAQPLTILQSRIESAGMFDDEQSDCPGEELLGSLAIEVERLCVILRPMRELVIAGRRREPASMIDAWKVIGPVLEDAALLLADAGASLVTDPAHAPPLAWIAPGVLREIVTSMVNAAAATASAGDLVHVSCEAVGNAWAISVANANPRPRPVPTTVGLRLALAEVRALGQGGDFLFHASPFHARLFLSLIARSVEEPAS